MSGPSARFGPGNLSESLLSRSAESRKSEGIADGPIGSFPDPDGADEKRPNSPRYTQVDYRRRMNWTRSVAKFVRTTVETVAGVVGRWKRAARSQPGDGVGHLRDLPPGHLDLLAVTNGLVGDKLSAIENGLDMSMALEMSGVEPTRRVCFFVHGLMATPRWWRFPDDDTRWYGSDLSEVYGYTPVTALYNSGRSLAENGAALSQRITEFVDSYPEPIDEIAIVAHSMGGLVTHAAAAEATEAGHDWAESVDNVALLGVPHTGSPWAKFGHIVNEVVEAVPIKPVSALASLAAERSVGLHDLRFGRGIAGGADRFPNASYYLAAATLAREPGVAARLGGDGLVTPSAALGRTIWGRSVLDVEPAGMRVFNGRGHLAIMRSPDVSEQLVDWFAPRHPETDAVSA